MKGVDKEQEPVKSLAGVPFPENLMLIELWTTPGTRERQIKGGSEHGLHWSKGLVGHPETAYEDNCENGKSLLQAFSVAVLRRHHGSILILSSQ